MCPTGLTAAFYLSINGIRVNVYEASDRLWGAEYYLSRGQRDKADELINWVTNHAQRSGVFSEQINPYTGEAPQSVVIIHGFPGTELSFFKRW